MSGRERREATRAGGRCETSAWSARLLALLQSSIGPIPGAVTAVGYRYLAAGRYPGPERELAKQLDFLRSLGIHILPPDGRTKL